MAVAYWGWAHAQGLPGNVPGSFWLDEPMLSKAEGEMSDILRGLNRYLRGAALAGWYALFPVAFFKLAHTVFTHWRGGTFSTSDALVVFALALMVWLGYRSTGLPYACALVAVAYIAYSSTDG